MGVSAIQIENVSEDLQEAARRRAIEQGLTLSAYLLDILRRDLSVPSHPKWLARIRSRHPVEGVDVPETLEDVRSARDRVNVES